MKTDELHALDMATAKVMGFAFDEEFNHFSKEKEVRVGGLRRLFRPTRSRADAMEVLEWILRRYNISIITGCEYGIIDEVDKIRGSGETLPLAICKFALEVEKGRG